MDFEIIIGNSLLLEIILLLIQNSLEVLLGDIEIHKRKSIILHINLFYTFSFIILLQNQPLRFMFHYTRRLFLIIYLIFNSIQYIILITRLLVVNNGQFLLLLTDLNDSKELCSINIIFVVIV